MNGTPPAPLHKSPRLGDWIGMAPDGRVAFLSGRVELGQGNLTALLMMVADELDVPPASIALETARTDLSPNEGFTAGSRSIAVGGLALRWAASAFRRQLLALACSRLDVSLERLDVREGVILVDGIKSGYRLLEFAREVDLSLSVLEHACPKDAKARWQSFDKMDRVDLRERLLGSPFVHDMREPDMLYGAPVHPPGMSSRLLSLDLEKLKRRKGVVDVMRSGSFVGILATSTHGAMNAAGWARANGRWEETEKGTEDPVSLMAQSNAPAEIIIETGDMVKSPGRWYETTATRPCIFHGSIGPAAAVALCEDKGITVWTHSQGIFALRKALSMVLKTDEERICVIHRPGSGCYGHNGADDAALDAVLMAQRVPGRCVKVIWSRYDEFHASPMGTAMVTKARAFLGRDGLLKAFDVEVRSASHSSRPGVNGTPNLRAAAYLADPVRPAPPSDPPPSQGGGADRNAVPSYNVGAVRVVKRLVQNFPYRTSALRSLGAFNNVIAIETLMDDIAREIGVDPLQFRLRHAMDEFSKEILERLDSETIGQRRGEEWENAGWGMGYARYKGISGMCAVMVRVEAGDEIRVTDAISVSDVGEAISPDGVKNQIEGGIIQSISWTLKEAVPTDGVSTTADSWPDYPILRFSEVPRLRTILIERPHQPPLGAGEIAQGPTGAAVSNAVRDALGVRVTRLPITRDAIIAALPA